ncbi:OLC1v1035220C2 [Oldenlandia corymbosa var. corymbosa]|nr:OLC1v1035220C2 [Oldenlandia corymbosa var. corymbosa]
MSSFSPIGIFMIIIFLSLFSSYYSQVINNTPTTTTNINDCLPNNNDNPEYLYRIYVSDDLPANDPEILLAHCSRPNQDIGERMMKATEYFDWATVWKDFPREDEFSCYFRWHSKKITISAFNPHFAVDGFCGSGQEVNICYWSVRIDGFYIANVSSPPEQVINKLKSSKHIKRLGEMGSFNPVGLMIIILFSLFSSYYSQANNSPTTTNNINDHHPNNNDLEYLYRIYVSDDLPANDPESLVAHCARPNQDVGEKFMKATDIFDWSTICKMYTEEPEFSCYFRWHGKEITIPGFNAHLAFDGFCGSGQEVNICYWSVRADGMYLANVTSPPEQFFQKLNPW